MWDIGRISIFRRVEFPVPATINSISDPSILEFQFRNEISIDEESGSAELSLVPPAAPATALRFWFIRRLWRLMPPEPMSAGHERAFEQARHRPGYRPRVSSPFDIGQAPLGRVRAGPSPAGPDHERNFQLGNSRPTIERKPAVSNKNRSKTVSVCSVFIQVALSGK